MVITFSGRGGLMTGSWTPEQLQRINAAVELQIAVERVDGTGHRWVPIWVVCVGEHVFVRTWYRRTTGWFGHVLDSRRARIRVPGLEAAVAVDHLDEGPIEVCDDIDAAYHSKYRCYGPSTVAAMYGPSTVAAMASAEARATTLRLTPREKVQLLTTVSHQ